MHASVESLRERLSPAMQRRLADYVELTRLQPIGIGLLLWPTLWALWVASGGRPSLALLAIFVVGTVLMRSAGCVVNDFFDRNIDPYVARTRSRPLAARRRSPYEALALAAVLAALALLLALQLNAAALRLACIGARLPSPIRCSSASSRSRSSISASPSAGASRWPSPPSSARCRAPAG
jgi:4-hydroxybenzoate polyprenyltransferase